MAEIWEKPAWENDPDPMKEYLGLKSLGKHFEKSYLDSGDVSYKIPVQYDHPGFSTAGFTTINIAKFGIKVTKSPSGKYIYSVEAVECIDPDYAIAKIAEIVEKLEVQFGTIQPI